MRPWNKSSNVENTLWLPFHWSIAHEWDCVGIAAPAIPGKHTIQYLKMNMKKLYALKQCMEHKPFRLAELRIRFKVQGIIWMRKTKVYGIISEHKPKYNSGDLVLISHPNSLKINLNPVAKYNENWNWLLDSLEYFFSNSICNYRPAIIVLLHIFFNTKEVQTQTEAQCLQSARTVVQ